LFDQKGSLLSDNLNHSSKINLMEQKQSTYSLGLAVIGAMFFIFGFATTFIITLSAKVKEVFELSEFKAQLITSAFFIAYPLLSIPSGYIIKKIGYKTSLIAGLVLMAVGSFLFFPAASIPSYPLFLTATFVLASGVVMLQVAANPYATALGPAETASGRLNMVQALNSVATMVAPWVISVVVFKGTAQMLDVAARAQTVKMPFVVMGVLVIIIALIILAIRLPEITSESGGEVRKSVWKYPHVLLGAFGIFMYVGAEVGNAGLIVNYLRLPENGGLSVEVASRFASIYWGGAMIGRFFGAVMLSDIKSAARKYMFLAGILVLALLSGAFVTDWHWKYGAFFLIIGLINVIIMHIGVGKDTRTLAVFAGVAALLALTTAFTTGQVALWTVVSIGFFNSVMFPNIFSLGVKDLQKGELSKASGIINSLILGGAIIPLIMGKIADTAGYSWAFIVPAISYIYIMFFALKGSQIR
jgi:FHS family L-fucose permease-like MFS transporter